MSEPVKLVRGRPWPKGVSGNPGGRPKDAGRIRELARQYTEEALEALVTILRDPGASASAKVAAATAILDRGWGKPTQPLAAEGEVEPLQIIVAPEVRRALDELGG